MTEKNNILQFIRLSLLEKVGPINARKLVAYCGGVEAIFKQNGSALSQIPGIGEKLASHILSQNTLSRAEEEMEFIVKNNLQVHSYLDDGYPKRLSHCEDAPILIYSKGDMNLDAEHVISIVGTRKATDYGKKFIADFLKQLTPYSPLVVSGLAFGIDICAHREAMKNGLQTVGVVAHGMDRLYPAQHRRPAENMMANGGLLTEFVSGTNPDPERFPMRNRIVAGLSDATIVVESAARGGSMITAYLANGYNRDVFAVPGRVDDEHSKGTNLLIRNDVAHLLDGVDEFLKLMCWQTAKKKQVVQKALFVDLSEEQDKIIKALNQEGRSIDLITLDTQMPMSKVSPLLLELEFKGLVRSLPGKRYSLA